MSQSHLIIVCAAITLAGLIAYVILGGADFGGGVWDLFAFGPRAHQQRQAIAHAMGPVWEANHVWLIFVIVMLFTCFSRGYAILAEALFVPFHLALVGIMLRGAAFIFRAHSEKAPANGSPDARQNKLAAFSWDVWQIIFGAASAISPFLLGAGFGTITSGVIQVDGAGHYVRNVGHGVPWLSPYSIGCGLLALSACSYLAAVYLVVETRDALREDFRGRAIVAGTTTAGLALVVLLLAWREAAWFSHALMQWKVLPVVGAGMLFFGASAWAVFTRRYRLAPIFAAGEIVLLLVGWGLAQMPYLAYPDVTLSLAASSAPVLRFMLIADVAGMALVAPSLWLLFHVFKREKLARNQGNSQA